MFLVYDVGGSAVKYALLTKQGSFVCKGKIKTVNDIENVLDIFVESIGKIYDEMKEKLFLKSSEMDIPKGEKLVIEGIAMSLPGQVDVENGIVYGGGAIRYLNEVNLGELVSKRCDNLPIALENDGKCAALAEVWLGNAKGMKDVCVLIFGTGIGGGIVIDGKVYHGHQLKAGEVSFCFDNFTFDDIDKMGDVDALPANDSIRAYPYQWSLNSSTQAMVIHVADKKNMDVNEVNGELIYKWIEEGDRETIEIVERHYFDIAKYIMNLHVILNPEIILIGGGISAQPAFVEGIKRYVKRLQIAGRIFKGINIDVCKYQNDSNLYGALYNYFQKFNV